MSVLTKRIRRLLHPTTSDMPESYLQLLRTCLRVVGQFLGVVSKAAQAVSVPALPAYRPLSPPLANGRICLFGRSATCSTCLRKSCGHDKSRTDTHCCPCRKTHVDLRRGRLGHRIRQAITLGLFKVVVLPVVLVEVGASIVRTLPKSLHVCPSKIGNLERDAGNFWPRFGSSKELPIVNCPPLMGNISKFTFEVLIS